MKLKILSFIFFFATLAPSSFSQIRVTVTDSISAGRMSYATVELLTSTDSALIAGITDDKGFITLPFQPNMAKIRVSFIGYKTYVAPITALDMSVLLTEDAAQLSEVSITGSNRTVKIDRDVYVITKELKAGTATSREMLGRLKGMVYNPYDQSLTYNGNSNILILVDGIEKDQNMAKTLSPDRIDRVEVIKDPIGKYAADGYKAVINIITKKDFSGIDITVNYNPMFNFIDPHGNPSPFLQQNANLNILYTYKKLNLYASYFNWYSKLSVPAFGETKYGDLLVKTQQMDYNNPNVNVLAGNNNVTLGGDYLLKEGNTLAVEINYNSGFNNNSGVFDLTNYLNNNIVGKSQSISKSRGTNDALQTTLTYHGKWSEKSNFEADFRYRHSMPVNLSIFEQGIVNSESRNNQSENFYRINAGYTYQINPKLTMDLGYGAILLNNNFFQEGQTLTQNQLRHRPSVYFSYALSDKLNFKAGAMVETYNQKFSSPFLNADLKQSQVGFLPLINIMYRPSAKFSVTAKYNATPGYPDINSLSTFQTQTDTLTYYMGNPFLQPSNYQVVSLEFNFLKFFNVIPFYDFDFRNNQQYLFEDKGLYFQKPVNTNFRKLGLNVNFTLPVTKTFMWQNFLQMSNNWISYNNTKNQQFSYIFNSMFIYMIPKWDAMAVAGLQKMIAKRGTLQGYNQGGNDIPMVMLQKNFLKKKLSCSFIYIPPIPEGFLRYSQDNMTRAEHYYEFSSGGIKLLHNLMLLQVTFHFNQGKQIKVTKSSLEDDTTTKQKSGIL